MSGDNFAIFSTTIRKVLECPDRQVVLRSLSQLARREGTELNGTTIQPLPGLGEYIGKSPGGDNSYGDTMRALLTWGLRSFTVGPSYNGEDLWNAMTILDGPGGYNQRLFTTGTFVGGTRVQELEGGLLMPSPSIPTIVIRTEPHGPIQPLNVDLEYVPNFLREKADCSAVIATSSIFGWKDLCIPCICLYVDAEEAATECLAGLAACQELPTIIWKGKLKDTATVMDTASELVAPPSLDRLEISARKSDLRKNPVVRAIEDVGPFMHGQSISLIGQETKGSVSVFLSSDEDEDEVWALTAYHVVPLSTNETRVITPGGLDVLTRLLHLGAKATHEADISFLLDRWEIPCGYVQYEHIGTNSNGWRSDWALIRLDERWRGINGEWMYNEMVDFYARTTRNLIPFSKGIVDCSDPEAGQICYKDGAYSGCTVGIVAPSRVMLFKKGAAEAATEEEKDSNPENVDESEMFAVHPVRDDSGSGVFVPPLPVVHSGDSGSGAFVPVPEKDGWNWAGQFVSIFYELKGSENIGLMVPQSQIFSSLEEVTGKSWKLAVKKVTV